MGIQECQHKGKYLGHLFCQEISKKEAYKDVMEKLSNKLACWKQKALSMSRRLILIKEVAQAIPTYTMQVILLPKHMLSKMDQQMREFF